MESVELIASGYEWICPECETMYTEIEITEHVKCEECGITYEVGEYYHSIK